MCKGAGLPGTSPAEVPGPDLTSVAEDKLRNVLGAAQAREVLDETLAALGLAAVESTDQLRRVSEALKQRGGIIAAIGAMLGVQATLLSTRAGGASSPARAATGGGVWAGLPSLRDPLAAAIAGAPTLEIAARRYVALVENACDGHARLVRVYVTAPVHALPRTEQAWLRARLAGTAAAGGLRDDTPCLVLLATRGVEPAWNQRTQSRDHRVIPLVDLASIRAAPMIARLLSELGGPSFAWVDSPQAVVRNLAGGLNGVFHVADARTATDELGRRVIPAEGFVRDQRIRSVFGSGGAYLDGTVVIAVVFADEAIDRATTERSALLTSRFKVATEAIVAAGAIWEVSE